MLSTKERILAAATNLLDTGGPSAVTLRAVGDAAGISQSAPYRHFSDKRALMDAVVRQITEQIRAPVEKARSEVESPLVALNLVVGQYYDFARRYPVRYRLLLEESRSDSPVGKEARQVFSSVAELVHGAHGSGELREGDPGQIAALVFGAVHGVADLEQFGLVNAPDRPDAADSAPALLLSLLSRGAESTVP